MKKGFIVWSILLLLTTNALAVFFGSINPKYITFVDVFILICLSFIFRVYNNKTAIVIFIFCIVARTLIWYDFKNNISRDPWTLSKSYQVRGLDLSHHNGDINFDKINFIDFVFLKATEGSTWNDKAFTKNYSAFKKKKIEVGAYHFFRFDVDGKIQARNFLSHLKGKEFNLPLIVDVEQNSNPFTSRSQVITRLKDFVNEIKNRTGSKPIIYTNGIGYSLFIFGEFDDHPLWLSATNSILPSIINCKFWQFNITGVLPELSHEADLNVFKGSRKEWEEYLKNQKGYKL